MTAAHASAVALPKTFLRTPATSSTPVTRPLKTAVAHLSGSVKKLFTAWIAALMICWGTASSEPVVTSRSISGRLSEVLPTWIPAVTLAHRVEPVTPRSSDACAPALRLMLPSGPRSMLGTETTMAPPAPRLVRLSKWPWRSRVVPGIRSPEMSKTKPLVLTFT